MFDSKQWWKWWWSWYTAMRVHGMEWMWCIAKYPFFKFKKIILKHIIRFLRAQWAYFIITSKRMMGCELIWAGFFCIEFRRVQYKMDKHDDMTITMTSDMACLHWRWIEWINFFTIHHWSKRGWDETAPKTWNHNSKFIVNKDNNNIIKYDYHVILLFSMDLKYS